MSVETIHKKFLFNNLFIYLKSLVLLMKPRVMSLVIFTSTVGLLTAPEKISFVQSVLGIFFVTLGAGAAGALNMW